MDRCRTNSCVHFTVMQTCGDNINDSTEIVYESDILFSVISNKDRGEKDMEELKLEGYRHQWHHESWQEHMQLYWKRLGWLAQDHALHGT